MGYPEQTPRVQLGFFELSIDHVIIAARRGWPASGAFAASILLAGSCRREAIADLLKIARQLPYPPQVSGIGFHQFPYLRH
jgi:hypothetical protein